MYAKQNNAAKKTSADLFYETSLTAAGPFLTRVRSSCDSNPVGHLLLPDDLVC